MVYAIGGGLNLRRRSVVPPTFHKKCAFVAICRRNRLCYDGNSALLDLAVGGVRLELPTVAEDELAQQYPTRLPVWWARGGEVQAHPVSGGVSGRLIVIRFPKKFTRLEKFFQRIFRGPTEIRRPLDRMNSLLWELSNGRRTFAEICASLDATFHEDIAPVAQRTASALAQFQRLGLLIILEKPSDRKWKNGPGITPPEHHLDDDYPNEFDITSLDGEGLLPRDEE